MLSVENPTEQMEEIKKKYLFRIIWVAYINIYLYAPFCSCRWQVGTETDRPDHFHFLFSLACRQRDVNTGAIMETRPRHTKKKNKAPESFQPVIDSIGYSLQSQVVISSCWNLHQFFPIVIRTICKRLISSSIQFKPIWQSKVGRLCSYLWLKVMSELLHW